MAVGEKRLFSLINATVSHEMRNPTNAVQSQIQEQQRLNLKQKDIVDNLRISNLKHGK